MPEIKVIYQGFSEILPSPVLQVGWGDGGEIAHTHSRFTTTGTLKSLLLEHFRVALTDKGLVQSNPVPVSIWLDRLEEEPSELLDATPDQHRMLVAYLRNLYPNGVSTYLLFVGWKYYPVGGWKDFAGRFGTVQQALDHLATRNVKHDWWYQLTDAATDSLILHGNTYNGVSLRHFDPNDKMIETIPTH